MNKILHRTLTALVAIAAFAIPTVLLSRAGFPLFLIFLLATTISIADSSNNCNLITLRASPLAAP